MEGTVSLIAARTGNRSQGWRRPFICPSDVLTTDAPPLRPDRSFERNSGYEKAPSGNSELAP